MSNLLNTNYTEASLIPILSAAQLLQAPPLAKLLRELATQIDLPPEEYQSIYQDLIQSFAEMVQLLPSVEGGALGSLLTESVRRACLAVQIQLEESKEPEPLFTYAVFSAALLIDIRKILVNRKILLADEKGVYVSTWMPFEGAITDMASHYHIRLCHQPMEQLNPAITIVLAQLIMPETGFLWLCSDLRLFNLWLAILIGDEEGSGRLAHILKLTRERLQKMKMPLKVGFAVDILQPQEFKMAEAFWVWVKEKVAQGEMDKPEDAIHSVEEGIFLEVPKIFQEFCVQYKMSDWKKLYQQFIQLGIAQNVREEEADADVDAMPEYLMVYFSKEQITPPRQEEKKSIEQAKILPKSFLTSMPLARQEKTLQQVIKEENQKTGVITSANWFYASVNDAKKATAIRNLKLEASSKEQRKARKQRFALKEIIRKLIKHKMLAKMTTSFRARH